MKPWLLLLSGTLFLSAACSKQKAKTEAGSETVVYGHLRYDCPCWDGPGLYYVTEPTDIIQNPSSKTSASDSVLLIGDGKGGWLTYITPELQQYVNVRTALHGNLTGKKGCLLGGRPANIDCKSDLAVIDTIGFVLAP